MNIINGALVHTEPRYFQLFFFLKALYITNRHFLNISQFQICLEILVAYIELYYLFELKFSAYVYPSLDYKLQTEYFRNEFDQFDSRLIWRYCCGTKHTIYPTDNYIQLREYNTISPKR